MTPLTDKMATPKEIMNYKTYRPTMEEFSNFKEFVNKIEREDQAQLAGICKIIPPAEWIPRKSGYNIENMDFTIENPVQQNFTPIETSGAYMTLSHKQPKMTLQEYYKMATSSKYECPKNLSPEEMERKYWKNLQPHFVPPIYGCDVDNVLSDPDLEVWNISKLDSILNLVGEDLDQDFLGINSPYLYFGMWKATFSWHVEDMDLYGINCVHYGAPKTWYCVPPKYGHLLEKVCAELYPQDAEVCSAFMRHKTCLVGPQILEKHGVPYQTVVQGAREIIIVFPYAYHCGFNHGFNIAESVNFATERWIEYGKRYKACNCEDAKVLFSMDPFVKKFQPELYEKWIQSRDIAPHPEDPPETAEKIKCVAKDPVFYAKCYTRFEEDQNKIKESHLYRFNNPNGNSETVTLNGMFKVTGTKSIEFCEFMLKYSVENMIENGMLEKISQQIPEDTMEVHLYRHITNEKFFLTIDPKTYTIIKGNSIKDNYFKHSSMKTLIDRGIFYKMRVEYQPKANKRKMSTDMTSDTKKIRENNIKKSCDDDDDIDNDPDWSGDEKSSKSKKSKTSPTKVNNNTKKIDENLVEIYKHVSLKNCGFIYHLNSKILTAEGEQGIAFLESMPGISLEFFVETGVLIKVGESIQTVKPRIYDVLYQHLLTRDFIILTTNFKFVGKKSEKIQKLLANQDLRKLVHEGILIRIRKIARDECRRRRANFSSNPTMPTIVNVYRHTLTNDLIPITPDLKVVGRKTPKVANLLLGKNVKELIQQGILVQLKKLQPKICEIDLTESDCDNTTTTTIKMLPTSNKEDIEKNIETVKEEEKVQVSTCSTCPTTTMLPNGNKEDIDKNVKTSVKVEEKVQVSTCPNFIVEDEF